MGTENGKPASLHFQARTEVSITSMAVAMFSDSSQTSWKTRKTENQNTRAGFCFAFLKINILAKLRGSGVFAYPVP